MHNSQKVGKPKPPFTNERNKQNEVESNNRKLVNHKKNEVLMESITWMNHK
jgi:hypothetical protein